MLRPRAHYEADSLEMAAVDVKAQLEQRYIELLEKRVASLEALVNTTPEDVSFTTLCSCSHSRTYTHLFYLESCKEECR